MIAVRHLNSNPEIAELPNIHPHGLHRGPTSHLPSCRPGGVHFTHHPTAPKQVLDILRKTPTAQNISPGIRASHKTFTISCSPPCSLSDFRTLTHTDKEKSQTPPHTHTHTPTFSTATTWWYPLKPRVHARCVPGATMHHHETTQGAAGEAQCFTLGWASVSLKAGFTWVV